MSDTAASSTSRFGTPKPSKRPEYAPTPSEIKRAVAHFLAMALVADYQRLSKVTVGSPSGPDRDGVSA
jgi:hypothetical protein